MEHRERMAALATELETDHPDFRLQLRTFWHKRVYSVVIIIYRHTEPLGLPKIIPLASDSGWSKKRLEEHQQSCLERDAVRRAMHVMCSEHGVTLKH